MHTLQTTHRHSQNAHTYTTHMYFTRITTDTQISCTHIEGIHTKLTHMHTLQTNTENPHGHTNLIDLHTGLTLHMYTLDSTHPQPYRHTHKGYLSSFSVAGQKFMKRRSLLNSWFWRMGNLSTWHQRLWRAFVLYYITWWKVWHSKNEGAYMHACPLRPLSCLVKPPVPSWGLQSDDLSNFNYFPKAPPLINM